MLYRPLEFGHLLPRTEVPQIKLRRPPVSNRGSFFVDRCPQTCDGGLDGSRQYIEVTEARIASACGTPEKVARCSLGCSPLPSRLKK